MPRKSNWHRYYDPSLCRFINSDVFGISSITKDINAGSNLFAYCNNDAVNYKDPTGTIAIRTDVLTNAIDWAIALIPVIRSFNSVLKSFNVSRKTITQIVKTITKFLKNNRTAIKKLLVTALKKVKVKSAYTWANRILKIVNYTSKLNTFLMTISKISVGNLIVWGIGLFAKHKYMYAKKYITFGAKVRVKYYIF